VGKEKRQKVRDEGTKKTKKEIKKTIDVSITSKQSYQEQKQNNK